MLNLFNRKKIMLTAMGAEISASTHTNGHAGGAIHEMNAWVYQYN